MRFVKESRIAAPPSEVFAFHEAPGAFERLAPPGRKLEVLEGGDSIRDGARLTFRTALGPLPITWVAEHSEYDPPHGFADRQVSGPFASWFHRHRFLDDGEGGTILRDEVDYQPPLGLLGRLLAGPLLVRMLRQMFDHRHEVTKRLLEAGDFPGSPRNDG